MAKFDPTQHDYVALVSEWQGSGGAVGNAYPLYSITAAAVVSEPEEMFPNSGAIFLTSRVGLRTLDFIRVRPSKNSLYVDSQARTQCYYIQSSGRVVLTAPQQLESMASILDHPGFDVRGGRQIVSPKSNVLPLFFVRKQQIYYGPLIRETTHLSNSDELLRIDWRPARDDSIVYEFTREELEKEGVKVVAYTHPQPLNRVVITPVELAIGKIRLVKSTRFSDALAEETLIEWYLHRTVDANLSRESAESLRAAFKSKPGEDESIMIARLRRIEKLIAGHSAFQDERDRFARNYLESSAGAKRLQDAIEQAVATRGAEIQEEVDRRQHDLAQRRNELANQLQLADVEHQAKLGELKQTTEAERAEFERLNASVTQLREQLGGEIEQFAEKIREQVPLLAAFSSVRPAGTSGPATVTIANPTVANRRWTFEPVPPERPLHNAPPEKQLVLALHADLVRQGLHFDRDFIANIYTCLKSESLNLLIGPPGFGKSSLVAAMAIALGHGRALLRIAVRRSWAEDRHLLGAFDSFHGRYDSGATGLVPRMLQASKDWETARRGIYMVLLDEFNLAAPEYYFSQLLQALPGGDRTREISLYDPATTGGDGFPASVTLAPNLRFWGTINYDETTERLSPRVLDRTGMVFLQESDVRRSPDRDQAPMPGVSAADLFEKLCKTAEECPTESWELVSAVIDLLRSAEADYGPRLELSPRVQQGIRRYLANAVDVLEPRLAADFAVQQRILPVLRGRGPGYLARIRRLQEALFERGMARAAQHVERVLGLAERQFGEVDFLAY